MRLAVSFCNLRRDASAGIATIDLDTGQTQAVPAPVGATSVTGLCVEGGFLYAAFHRGGSYVAVYDAATLVERAQFALPEVSDIHSIDRRDNTLLSVSTGTDTVARHTLLGTGARSGGIVWSPASGDADSIHLNGATRAEGRALVSGFGPRKDGSWNAADRGFVYDLEEEEIVPGFAGIHHPHSVIVHSGEVFCLESVTGKVVTAAGRSSWSANGYARGLCFVDKRSIAVGTSIGRRAGEELVANNVEPGEPAGTCGVTIATLATGPERFVPLDAFNNEIYDVVVLP